MRTLHVHSLGRVEYLDGLRLMATAAEQVGRAEPPGVDHLFLLEHPPLITLGRGAGAGSVVASPAWLGRQGIEVHETDRGGDVTYHGPGQVVGYPVVDLSDRRDVRRYVSALEEAMIRTCAACGVEAGRHPEHRGAWVGPNKIGAVGVHISRWVTSHGIALNVAPDLAHFSLIVPCGIADPRLGVTSLERELAARGKRAPPLRTVADHLAVHLAEALGRVPVDRGLDLRTVAVVPVAPDGRVLLLRRTRERGGIWQPVTGRLEPGEAPEQAALRELREETGAGAAVEPLGYEHDFALEAGVAVRFGGGLKLVRETTFRARLPEGFAPRLSGEHAEWAWFDPAEAEPLLPYAGLRKALRLAAAPPAA